MTPERNEGIRSDLSQQNPWLKPTDLQGRFGPGQAVLPTQPEEAPRLFQYRPGVNLVSMPRTGFGLVNFATLRNLAATCKEIRLNIELIKRQVRGLEWEITPRQKTRSVQVGASVVQAALGAEIDAAQDFFERLDGTHDFDAWLNQLMEELLVTDAVTLWPDANRMGELLGLEVIDGTTIRPLLDLRGRIARPPLPGYLQMLHGMAMSAFTSDRLIYRPLNSTVYSPYGTSPIEWVLMAVNLSMRREINHVASFTEGNVPEALIGAPADWGKEQIDTWQQYWDALATGNVAALRKMHWVPIGGSGQGGDLKVYEFRKDDITSTERDKWLMQVACWAYGNSPAEFGLASGDGLGGKGFGESQENVQYRSMIGPITQYLERLFNVILRDWLRKPYLKFGFIGLEPREDALQQAQVDQAYIASGVYSTAFVQDRMNIPPEFRPEPGSVQAQGMLGLQPTVSPVGLPFGRYAGDDGFQVDLRRWMTKSLKAVKAGRGASVSFVSQTLDAGLMNKVEAGLELAHNEAEVRQVFTRAAQEASQENFFHQGWNRYG